MNKLLSYIGGRGLTEEMLAEDAKKITGVPDSDAELDLENVSI